MQQLDFPSLGKQFYDHSEVVIKSLLLEEQAPCPVFHRFGPGLYIREVHFPAGIFAIGHEHRVEQMNVFIKGKVQMLHPDGTTSIMEAPMTFMGKPGRKCGVILEDVVWQNIYATDETDIDKLEEMFLVKPEFWYDHLAKLEVARLTDQQDYAALLGEYGLTEEQVQLDVGADNVIPMPFEWSRAVVRDSAIHGKGFFATTPFESGEVIAPARLGDKRTPAGRYTNHSQTPNAVMRTAPDGDLYLVASRSIQGCMGGGMGDEITVDYRQVLSERRVP
jgi:hypothetical protein